jgi:spore coat protein U-like protein
MNNKLKTSLVAAALVAAGLASSTAFAATASGSVAVTATIGANCILTTVPMAFGVYDPLSATPKTANGQVQLVCTVGAAPAVAVDNGLNASGAQRRLGSGANMLNYDVFTPVTNAANAACAYTTAYPTVAPGFALTAAPSTASRTYNLCGQIPALQSVPNGSYTDTVTATITF